MWRYGLRFRRQGSPVRCGAHILAKGRGWGRSGRTLEVRRSNETARILLNGSGLGLPRCGGYYTNPVETALVLWRHGLA